MKEPVKPIHKSYRTTNLHSYQVIPFKPKKHLVSEKSTQTNIYLLIQSCSTNPEHNYTICKYVSLNANSTGTYLPTTRPDLYLNNTDNIVSSLLVKLNETTILNVYWLRSIDTYDIFKYKICYIQIPVNLTLLKFSHVINGKHFYYSTGQANKKLLELPVTESDETDKLLDCFAKIDLNI